MKMSREKRSILILSSCLGVSVAGNIFCIGRPSVQSKKEKTSGITWMQTVEAPAGEVIYPEITQDLEHVIQKSPESMDTLVVEANPSLLTENEEMPVNTPEPTPEPTEQPAPTERPSIRYNGATVYVTKSGKKFHREDCSSLSKSKIPMSFEEACEKMYEPCGRCNP